MQQPNNPTIVDDLAYIVNRVPTEDMYKELAEEASELAQAALKMCRINSQTNPTSKTEKEAWDDLIEEYTDVLNIAMRVLNLKPDWLIGDYKIYRWRKRLEEAQNGHVCNEDYCEIRR